ncbi:hypothetical protein [Paraburkholderia sp. RL17-337-BIB-A]|uniref:hypothetical protein n=1 Tax=Paraburkholderia sp. RL17-337-BIB-A TaxID=3031636 RepID=UPI0038B8F318
MVNLTPHSVVFNRTGDALHADIRAALTQSADALLLAYGLEHIDLAMVTTSTHLRGAYAKFVRKSVLSKPDRRFDEAYVREALEAYRQKTGYLTEAHFKALMFPSTGMLAFKRSYAVTIRPGVGLFLVALHSSGAITLPITFPWPSIRNDAPQVGAGRRREVGGLVASELLAFIRTLDSQSDSLPHAAFDSVGRDRKRKEWFLTYGTKLLLATGWHRAEDVNIRDLLAIKGAEEVLSPNDTLPLAYKALLDVLKSAFGERVAITAESWAAALRDDALRIASGLGRPEEGPLRHIFDSGPRSDRDLLQELLHVEPVWAKPERIRALERLPGLEVDIRSMSEQWLELEELYVRKTARESYKQVKLALRWWNIYLFYYLPYWFARNPGAVFTYPRSPSLLLKTVFVSRLLPLEQEMPVTFIEFMNAHGEHRKWSNNGYYANLLQLQGFFEFIERYSEELPGCEGFSQPLSPHDFPRTSRPKATKKRPVPRRLFAVYLDYHEALLAHHYVVTNLALSGTLSSEQVKKVAECGVIDTFASVDLVGFVPVLFASGKTIPLRFIPNVLDLGWRTVKGGRSVFLPHPHAVHQNLVALHTGLRHNHIQWLDRDLFDSVVGDDDTEFAMLFVNTDKEKKATWTPHVNIRVIELLRAQRDWVELIDEAGFDAIHFYNDNPSTKWPKFRPLFAYTKDGKPHDDTTYGVVWKSTLCGLQGLLPELISYGSTRPLLRLLPPGLRANDPDLKLKLEAYGKRFGAGEHCQLNVMTSVTPHSSRVAVVSQYITFLPTDLIGKHITGQRPGVVNYYVHLDQETLEIEQVHQAARMRDAALRNAFEPVLTGRKETSAFIHADSVNSRLAQSMRANLDETLVSYGCISISFNEKAAKGVDVLRLTRGIDAAANKTEICPYNNICPPEVVKDLRGTHRCSLCDYAVRSVDHLPAVGAKKRQVAEMVDELEALLSADEKTLNAKYTGEELDRLEEERGRLCEELTGWILSEEVLELTRQRIAAGTDNRKWLVQRPEIIERDLQRVVAPTSMTEYLLARLGECIAYPTMQSPQVRARFDLLRRELLAKSGNLRAAFAQDLPIDPAAECAGLLKSIAGATGLNAAQLAEVLDKETSEYGLSRTSLRLLGEEESEQ